MAILTASPIGYFSGTFISLRATKNPDFHFAKIQFEYAENSTGLSDNLLIDPDAFPVVAQCKPNQKYHFRMSPYVSQANPQKGRLNANLNYRILDVKPAS